ncbi:MAG: hypothetical protein JWN64_827 [Parcubacteria group bacterium]|nr:hypothetical protein [Parcubacteria group bacterium]
MTLSACQSAQGGTFTGGLSTLHEPAPVRYVSPYADALKCLKSQLSPQQSETAVGILYFTQRTGKEVYAADSASGKYLSDGGEDMLMNSLLETGIKVVELGIAARNLSDYMAARIPRIDEKGQPLYNPAALPDLQISGSFSALDFGSGDVKELRVKGIGGGKRVFGARYLVTARMSNVVGGHGLRGDMLEGAVTVAKSSFKKDVMGQEIKAGVASFFGGPSSDTYIELNLDHEDRQLMQLSQQYSADYLAYDLVSQWAHITVCEPHREYGDYLLSGNYVGKRPVPVSTLAQKK